MTDLDPAHREDESKEAILEERSASKTKLVRDNLHDGGSIRQSGASTGPTRSTGAPRMQSLYYGDHPRSTHGQWLFPYCVE